MTGSLHLGGLRMGCGRQATGTCGAPYVSERQWGTVREDYSPDGEAWTFLPHDWARSHAYRWGEDGMAGFSDIEQRLCLGLALWNGRDPILKERMFGLTGAEANHGEDVKEYWWYLDALPSHAWNRWRYHYPQQAFPYEDLREENGRRGKHDPEYELLDTGVFDAGYWITEVHYAKANPTDLLMVVSVTNAGPDTDTLHVLPTAWFRNTWSWDIGAVKPEMAATGTARSRWSTRTWAPWSCWPTRHQTAPSRTAVLRERDERGPAVRCPGGDALSQGRDQRPRAARRAERQPGPARHQVRGLVPAGGGAGRHGRAAAAAPATQEPGPRRRSARRSAGRWPPGARKLTSSTPS